jgi:hypothetical protein
MHDAGRDPQSGRGKRKPRRLGNRHGGGALGKAVCAARGMSAWTMTPPVRHRRRLQDGGSDFDPIAIRRQNLRRRHLYVRDRRNRMMAGMGIGRRGSEHDGQEQR